MEEILVPDQNLEDNLSGNFLTFYINGAIYGIEMVYVIEVISMQISVQSITRIPYLPPYIKGVINLRGGVVPIVDVRIKFHLEEKEYDESTCIIIVDIQGMRIGMIVDSVSEVVSMDSENMSVPPKVDTAHRNEYLRCVAEVGNKIILNLDCEKFFLSDIA